MPAISRLLLALSVAAWALLGAAAHAAAPPGDAPARVPIARLLADEAALVSWLSARHPDIAAAGARVRQADALVDQSRVIPNPTLGLSTGMALGRRNPASLAFGDAMNLGVGVSETIELGKRGPRARAAEFRREGSRAQALGVLVNRVADARDALARTLYFGERARILTERLASARNVVALEKVRLDKGDISGIEHDRLELEAASVARDLADTRAELDLALADCSARLVGDCAGTHTPLDAIDAAALLPGGLTASNAIEQLVRSRPETTILFSAGPGRRASTLGA